MKAIYIAIASIYITLNSAWCSQYKMHKPLSLERTIDGSLEKTKDGAIAKDLIEIVGDPGQ